MPSSLIVELFSVGFLALSRGEFDQGAVLFRALKELRPKAEIFATYLVYCLYVKGEYSEALDIVDAVVSEGVPESACMRAVRAKVWFMANDPRWLREFESALELEVADGSDEKVRYVLQGLSVPNGR